MNKYMAYDKGAGKEEGACLVFANSSQEARKLAYSVIQGWFDECDWIDIVAKTIKGHEYLNEECKSGEPHVIESPESCTQCGNWGVGAIICELCPACREIDEDE